MRYFTSRFLPLLAILVNGCTSAEPPQQPSDSDPSQVTIPVAVNAKCPIMGGQVTEDGGRISWKDQTIGFCCPECIQEWEALPDDEKSTKLKSEEDATKNSIRGDGSGQ